jgi:uncharacterized membrane protein YdbT with pleckstrin-like domain
MAFIERNLMPGETLVYRTRMHWVLLLAPTVFTVLALFALIAVAVKVGGNWTYLPLALVVISVFAALARYVIYLSSEFGVTTHRVIVKVGLVTIRSIEILLPKIEAIQIEQNIWGRIFNYGTILITGTGGTREVFAMIESPYDLRSQVQKQLMLLQQPRTQ